MIRHPRSFVSPFSLARKYKRSTQRGRRAVLAYELLEQRQLLASDWTNPNRPADVDGNGYVEPLDALVVLNQFSSNQFLGLGSSLPNLETQQPPPYFDVNGDDSITPLDALLVLITIARGPSAPEIVSVSLQTDSGPFGTINDDRISSVAIVVGRAVDPDNPLVSIEARINDGSYESISFDSLGRFEFNTALSLAGTDDGEHVVTIRATDETNLVSPLLEFTFTLDTTPPQTPTLELAPAFLIGSPQDQQTTGDVVTLQGITSAGARLRLGAGITEVTAAGDGRFEFTSVPLSLGANALTVIASDVAGNLAETSVTITRIADRVGPELSINGPLTRVTNSNITVSGTVGESATMLLGQIDLGDVFEIPITGGTFTFNTVLPTNGSGDGQHLVRLRAEDARGNQSPLATIVWTLDTVAPIASTDFAGTVRNQSSQIPINFSEPLAQSSLDAASYSLSITSGPRAGQTIAIQSVRSEAENRVVLVLPQAMENVSHRLQLGSGVVDRAGNRAAPSVFDFTVAQPTRLAEVSPAHGEELVSVTRETIIRFDREVDPATINSESFFITAAGQPVNGNIRVSSTERFATFFYNEPLPASTQVRVTVDGNRILGRDGMALDANNDSQPGGVGVFDFRTLPLSLIPNTSVWGYVYDSYNVIPQEKAAISVPQGDPQFDPTGTGVRSIAFARAEFFPGTGDSESNPRLHPNRVTSFIDASAVYGSDETRARALRMIDGSGRLKTSGDGLLPTNNLQNFPSGVLANENKGTFPNDALPVAGDPRAAEFPGLAAVHALFVREHNRKADEVKLANPNWSDELVYQTARRWVSAIIQHITYQEYLPTLLGPAAIPAYTGYNINADPSISTLFSSAAFRIGHSQQAAEILRLDSSGNSLPGGPLALRDAFFNPNPINTDGIDPYLRGLIAQTAEEIDTKVVSDLRNFLFGPPGSGGLDLPSIGIQRGRDMGLPSYVEARAEFGLPSITSFNQISSNPAVVAALQTAYGTVDKVDIWVGGLAETHVTGGSVGPLFAAIMKDQFMRSRSGDRFWYENGQLSSNELAAVRATTFADLIERNSDLSGLPENVFIKTAAPPGPIAAGTAGTSTEFRTYDGTKNNTDQPRLASTNQPLIIADANGYGDGSDSIGGADRPSPRAISNQVFSQSASIPSVIGLTSMSVVFGQFLSHDMSFTPAQSVKGTDIPVVGAKLSLDALPSIFATTDKFGFFELGGETGLPAPDFFVHIDGSTAINAPAGAAYATLGKPFHSIAGQSVPLKMDGAAFSVYLPPMAMSDIVELDPNADTEVGFGPAAQAEIRAMFADDPARAQLIIDTMRVTYPAGSAQSESGVPATQATIIPVSPDRLPAPLPLGANPGLVISVQAGTDTGFNLAGGSTNFDVPAPAVFPNLSGLTPGDQTAIISFDHDLGQWVVTGSATVSPDGRSVVSSTGDGILAPGWHYIEPLVNVLVSANGGKSVPKDIPLAVINAIAGLVQIPAAATAAYGTAGQVAGNLPGLINSTSTSIPGGFSALEIASIGASVVFIGATIAGAPVVASAAFAFGAAATLLSAGLTITTALGGIDPPCNTNINSRNAGDYGVAASLCFSEAARQWNDYGTTLERLSQDLAVLNANLYGDHLRDRFASVTPGVNATVALDGTVNVVDRATGLPAIDPQTGLPYRLNVSELQPTALSASSEAAIVATAESLTLSFEKLTSILESMFPESVDSGIVLANRALDSLQRPLANGFANIGGRRIRLSSTGTGSVLLRANRSYQGSIVDANTGFVKAFSFQTGAPGSTLSLPTYYVIDPDTNDIDGDGLGELAESILGTNPNQRDSSGDGISDFAALQAGIDFLGGVPFETGVVSVLNVVGDANAIAFYDADSARQYAVIATGDAGISVVDRTRLTLPTISGRLNLVGISQDIDIDSFTSTAIVASGEGGLHFVDVSDPMIPREVRTVNIDATQVEVVDGVVYASSGSRVLAYDPASGDLLFSYSIPDSGIVTGLTHEGNFLYAMDAAAKLHVLEVQRFQLTKRGDVVLPEGGGQIFVSGGIVYTAAIGTYFRGGYGTVDVSNPSSPTLISGSAVVGPFVGPGKAIVANGSGLGLLVGSPNSQHMVEVQNLSDPSNTNELLTRFDLPAAPQSVAIASGIGYVASGTGGLVVVNYVPFDNRGTAPTVTATGPAGTTVQEGSFVSIRTVVTDDVQVRDVDLLMNGTVVARDVSAPFDLRAVTPALTDAASTVTFQVRATDTGGNVGLSSVLTYTLTPDITPPTIISSSPSDNGAGFRINAITLRFDEPIDSTRISVTGFTLTNLGDDFRVGGGDDTALAIDRIQALSPTRIVVYPSNPLPEGTFRLTGDSTVLADIAGNEVTTPLGITFTSLDFDEANSVAWKTDSDGNWNDPGNWSTGEVPGPNDQVIIDRKTANPTIRITEGNVNIRGLLVRDNFEITGGSLTVNASSEIDGKFEVKPGAALIVRGAGTVFQANATTVIEGGTLRANSGATIRLPQVTNVILPNTFGLTASWEASGTGSLIDLGSLTGIDAGVGALATLNIKATSGGDVQLDRVLQIIDQTSGGTSPSVVVSADGLRSVVDLSSLSIFEDLARSSSTLSATNSGTILAPNLTQLTGVHVVLDGTGKLDHEQWTNWINGSTQLSGTPHSFPSLANAAGTKFEVNGGSLELNELVSIAAGGITLKSGATASVPKLSNIDGASFSISGGVTFSVPMATSYTMPNLFGLVSTLEASGTGSVLNLQNIVGIDAGIGALAFVNIKASSGGIIDLNKAIQIVDQSTGGTSPSITVSADGLGSEVKLTSLTSFDDRSVSSSAINVLNKGTVDAPVLRDLRGVKVTLDGTGSLDYSKWINWVNGGLTLGAGSYAFSNLSNAAGTKFDINGGTLLLPELVSIAGGGGIMLKAGGSASVPKLTNIDGASFSVSGGVTLSIPLATTYTNSSIFGLVSTLEAIGIGSVLSLPNLVGLDLGDGTITTVNLRTTTGGLIDLSRLRQIDDRTTGGNSPSLQVNVDGVGSKIDLSGLLSFADRSPNSTVTVQNQGQLAVNSLENVVGVRIGVGSASLDFPQLTTFVSGGVSLNPGATLAVPKLAIIDGTSLLVTSGISLSLPLVTNFLLPNIFGFVATFEARGVASTLSIPNLVSIDIGSGTLAVLNVVSSVGGSIDLSGVQQIDDRTTSGNSPSVNITADGSTSSIDLSSLLSFADNSPSSSINLVKQGSVNVSKLSDVQGVSIRVEGKTFALPELTKVQSGMFRLTAGGTVAAPKLANIDGSSLFVSGGVNFTLPLLTTYTMTNAFGSVATIEASGVGSTIDLPNLVQIDLGSGTLATLNVKATIGGVANLSSVAQIVDRTLAANSPSGIITSDGSGSRIDLSGLTNFRDESASLSAISVLNSGIVALNTTLTELKNVLVTQSSSGQITGNYETTNGIAAVDVAPPLPASYIAPAQAAALFSYAVGVWDYSAVGLSVTGRSLLKSLQFQLTNLDGPMLAMAIGNTIYIDRNAAGWGWFIDQTPSIDEEFSTTSNPYELTDGSHEIDLLTVLMHEIGHSLGLEHVDNADVSSTLMQDTLSYGTRRKVSQGLIDQVMSMWQ